MGGKEWWRGVGEVCSTIVSTGNQLSAGLSQSVCDTHQLRHLPHLRLIIKPSVPTTLTTHLHRCQPIYKTYRGCFYLQTCLIGTEPELVTSPSTVPHPGLLTNLDLDFITHSHALSSGNRHDLK